MASDVKDSIMGDYATLDEINAAYKNNNAGAMWLVAAVENINEFCSSKSMTNEQIEDIAYMIANEYKDMKHSQLQLFFYRFKCGYFGKFYGKIDPMVITCALKDFADECEAKRQEYLNEEYLARKQAEDNLRQAVWHQWPEFLRELCGLIPEKETKKIVSDIDIDTIFVSDRTILLSVTEEQYGLLEKDYYDAFVSVFHKCFSGMTVRYKIRPQKAVQEDVAEDSVNVRKKIQVLSVTESVCRSAHAILDNVYKLDQSGVDSMRLAFQKRYGCWPEDYLAQHEEVIEDHSDDTEKNQSITEF